MHGTARASARQPRAAMRHSSGGQVPNLCYDTAIRRVRTESRNSAVSSGPAPSFAAVFNAHGRGRGQLEEGQTDLARHTPLHERVEQRVAVKGAAPEKVLHHPVHLRPEREKVHAREQAANTCRGAHRTPLGEYQTPVQSDVMKAAPAGKDPA